MNANATAVEIPTGLRAGAWVPGFGNTDPGFVQRLVGRNLSIETNLYESAEGKSFTASGGQRVSASRLVSAPEPRGIILDQLFSVPTNSSFVLVGDINGVDLTQSESVQFAVGATRPGSSEEQFGLFSSPGGLLRPLQGVSYLSFRGAAARAVLPNVQTVSSTIPVRDVGAETKFKAAFQRGREERFEDGMESNFSQELEYLVRVYGSSSREILARLLEDDSVSPRVWGEAMRSLGRIEDSNSREARLWVLEKGLTSESAVVRDGAALGLASLDDPSAIPYLQRAIDSENLGGLRADMEDVLLQLTRR